MEVHLRILVTLKSSVAINSIILTKWGVYVSWCACGLKSPSCSAPFEENAPIANRTYNSPFKKRTLVIKNCEIMVHFIQYS